MVRVIGLCWTLWQTTHGWCPPPAGEVELPPPTGELPGGAAVAVQKAKPSPSARTGRSALLVDLLEKTRPIATTSNFFINLLNVRIQPHDFYYGWSMPVNNFFSSQCRKRATGIEPAWPAWKAGTLPLSYARVAG